ncbi:hypothetical protein F442_07210 [Phytophthora nicotianae P10297]|uniref:Uncharacterized protein n=1 Tax=Phytophthora nicotianae P10297 TaxID=1317064 RepID=W2ZGP4_PHYNI|nr:hypothetical protein F442_07210 [Phytophthora nicotianae P10297]
MDLYCDVHEMLEQGCTFQVHLLQRSETTTQMQTFETTPVAHSSQVDLFEIKDLPPVAVTRGSYHWMKFRKFESIDEFYFPRMESNSTQATAQDVITWNAENRLILFQMSISKVYPVNVSEIMSVFEKLGLLEAVKSNPNLVALLFVAPKAVVGTYQRQDIIPKATDDRPVNCLSGIGLMTAKVLAQLKTNQIPEKKTRYHLKHCGTS